MAGTIGEESGAASMTSQTDGNRLSGQDGDDRRGALQQSPLVLVLLGMVIVLLVVVIGLVVLPGASQKSFAAKGMIRDSIGYMYDPSDGNSIFAGTEVEEFLRLTERDPRCVGGDLDETSILTIADAGGKVLATTPLVFEPSMSMGKDPDNWLDRGWCGFTFEVPEIKSDSDYFQLTVSNTRNGIPPVERQTLIDGAVIQLSGGYR